MSVLEIIDAMVQAGCTVRFLNDGKASIVGSVPDSVLQHIRANREAFLEAWREYQWNRYCSPPPRSMPLRSDPPRWRDDVYRRVSSYVMRQPDPVSQWTFWRSNEYREARPDWTVDEACKAALSDVLHWQLERHADPVQLLDAMDEVAAKS